MTSRFDTIPSASGPHADSVEFDEPQVRLLYGDPVQEPVMSVRVAADRAYTEDIVQDLVTRSADIEEVDWVVPLPVVRAEAPLRQLLGYAQSLAAVAHNTADVRMSLSHYEPVPPEPGKAA